MQKFQARTTAIVEQNSDLEPILNIVLFGLQEYQIEQTKDNALICLESLATVNNGEFRSKIWDWAKSTSIKGGAKGEADREGSAE